DPTQSGVSSLIYSTYLGGSSGELGKAIAVDGAGNAYVTGVTGSTDFPVKPNPGGFQTAAPNPGSSLDAFVTKLNAAGTDVVYSTYLGGSYFEFGTGIAVDGAGNAYVTGQTSSIALSTGVPVSGAFQPFAVTPSAFQSQAPSA